MSKNVLLLICLIVLFSWPNGVLAEQLIRYPLGNDASDFRYAYPVRLLQLLLDKTAQEYGAARAVNVDLSMTTSRLLTELENGELLDIVTSSVTRNMEKRFLSIPIGIRKGILGLRLFLIDRKFQPKFSAIRQLDELKKMRVGQGADWIDTYILKENGFNVVTGSNYKGLFRMLMMGRFDFFPRGLYEPFKELEQHALELPNLAVEKNLALYYHYPDYFWVNKNNTILAERLQKGFEEAIADGSFNDLYELEFGEVIKQANLERRLIFYIPNTEIDKIPNEGDPKYWFIEKMKSDGVYIESYDSGRR